ncbi:membrane protein [Cupriavidus sp. SK-3]|nr:membrane protein [Cupriavidus sp. SK-3]
MGMTGHELRSMLASLACGMSLLASGSLLAQGSDSKEKGMEAAWQAAQSSAQAGPATVKLGEQATLKLPAREVFIPQPAAGKLMHAMGNLTDERLLGLVLPTGDDDWMVVAKYEPSGYIRDDDAKDWNVDDLFNSLREGTEAANEEREKRGIRGLEIVGWVERPHYEAASHRLIWSMSAREKGQPADAPQSVNYNTYALGREGYVSLNLITARDQVDANKPVVRTLLSNLDFAEGKAYADFNSGTDKIAEYGLAALIGGVAAKKLGLLAVLAAFFAKFAKVIMLAVAGIGYSATKWFRRKPSGPAQPK